MEGHQHRELLYPKIRSVQRQKFGDVPIKTLTKPLLML
jgi:hypothetical protein